MCINFSSEVANVYEVYDLYFALPNWSCTQCATSGSFVSAAQITHKVIFFMTAMQGKQTSTGSGGFLIPPRRSQLQPIVACTSLGDARQRCSCTDPRRIRAEYLQIVLHSSKQSSIGLRFW